MGDYAAVEPLYQQVLELRCRLLGEGHPPLAHQPKQSGGGVLCDGKIQPRRAAPPPGPGHSAHARSAFWGGWPRSNCGLAALIQQR
jgi:hypothetical protein